MSAPTCSFVGNADVVNNPRLDHGVVARQYADPTDRAQCGASAAYTVVARFAEEADLCAVHAAHVRGCPDCASWLTSIRTLGTPAAGGGTP